MGARKEEILGVMERMYSRRRHMGK